MRPAGFLAAGELIAAAAAERRRRRRRRARDGGDPARLRGDRGPRGLGLVGFFVRKERKEHGLQRWVEGPVEPGTSCLVVEDTVTTGGSTVAAVERIREEGLVISAGVCVVDRLAGGAEAIAAATGGSVRGAGHDRRDLPGPAGPRGLGRGPTPSRSRCPSRAGRGGSGSSAARRRDAPSPPIPMSFSAPSEQPPLLLQAHAPSRIRTSASPEGERCRRVEAGRGPGSAPSRIRTSASPEGERCRRVEAGRGRMPRAGFEPAAYSLGGSRSIQLSYRGRVASLRLCCA